MSPATSPSQKQPAISPLDLPNVDHQSSGPGWRNIEEALRGPIVDGRWQRGAKLPVEAELAAHFKVNRHTLRRALGALVRDGFLSATQGKGTFVASRGKLALTLSPSGGPTQALSNAGAVPYARVISSLTREAGLKLAAALDVDPRRAVLEVELLIVADDQPIGLCRLGLSHERFSRFPDALRGIGLIEAALRGFGVFNLYNHATTLGAREATERETGLLKMRPPVGLLTCHTLYVDQSGARCAVADTVWLAQRVELVLHHQLALGQAVTG